MSCLWQFTRSRISISECDQIITRKCLRLVNLGNLLNDLRRSDEALHALQKADVLQPGTPEILNNIGIQHYARGEIESAVWHYEAALIGNPDFADALTNYGNALQRLYRLDEAQIALNARWNFRLTIQRTA